MPTRLENDDYTVGWICALPIEFAAAQAMLDESHETLRAREGDTNVYAYGKIFQYNVVMACLPSGLIGTNSAASVAMQMHRSFRSLKFVLMVGIGGGVPSQDHDIRLGDVVIGQPGNGCGGVIQYDFGKSRPDRFERTGFLNAPPTALLSGVSMIRTQGGVGDKMLETYLAGVDIMDKFARPPAAEDVVYKTTDNDIHLQVKRMQRSEGDIQIHYGTIASGNQVMRDAVQRDRVSQEPGGVLCFEMEAAGLMNNFPCLVIRGICDYADSHKTKNWQPFAAAIAAAYAKHLLSVLPEVEEVPASSIARISDQGMQYKKPTIGFKR